MLILICKNVLDMILDLTEKDFYSIDHEVAWNVIIFGVDMGLSPHIDNIKKIF